MSDDLDRLWPEWMIAKENELRAERISAAEVRKAEEADRDPHADCSQLELARKKMEDAKRRGERDDALNRPDKFRKQGRQA